MGHNFNKGLHLEKWVALGKMGHTWKNVCNLKNGCYLKKQAAFGKIGPTQKSGSHLENGSNLRKGSNLDEWEMHLKIGQIQKKGGHT